MKQLTLPFIKAVCDDLATKGTLIGDSFILDPSVTLADVKKGLHTLATHQRSSIWVVSPIVRNDKAAGYTTVAIFHPAYGDIPEVLEINTCGGRVSFVRGAL